MISAYFLEKSWKAPDDYKVAISHIDNHDNCAAIELTYKANDNPITPFRNKDFAINLRFITIGQIKVDFSTIVSIDQALEAPYITRVKSLEINYYYSGTLQLFQLCGILSEKLFDIFLDFFDSSCIVWMMQFYDVKLNDDFRNTLIMFGFSSQNGISRSLTGDYFQSGRDNNAPIPYF